MDSYIVRIYRRDTQAGKEIAGLVERIGNGERKAFQGEAQLIAYLSLEAPGSSKVHGGKKIKKT